MYIVLFQILSILTGIFCGIITGLCIGIHPNLFLPTISFLIYEYAIDTNLIIYFLIGWVISHYFINYIPTAYFGVPDSETAISVNALQKYVKNENTHQGIFLSGLGGLLSVLLSSTIILCLFSIASIFEFINSNNRDIYLIISNAYDGLKNHMAYILTIMLILAISTEKNKLWTFIISLCAGFLGVYTLSFNPSFDITLTLVFTGMFGVPILIHNILFGNYNRNNNNNNNNNNTNNNTNKKNKNKRNSANNGNNIQNNKNLSFEKKAILNYIYYSLLGTIGGFFRIAIPAFGGSQINYFLALFLQKIQNMRNLIIGRNNKLTSVSLMGEDILNKANQQSKSLENFLVSQGAIVVSNEMLSIWALMIIGVGRSGSAQLIKNLNVDLELFKFLGAMLISTVLSFIILLKISKTISKIFLKTKDKVNYKKMYGYLLVGILIIIMILTFLSQNMIYNLLIFIISTVLGLLCLYKRVNTSILMSYLIYPTILFYIINF
ncbi:putative membrane protein [Methanococcus voltae]|uniref:tripartite tricarboxylate transporter permease n=1 Tax=Methanococcus voltae TaxID=2188 RepID=UPI001AE8CF20|nr:tripartite tricarboxylate transporter permease [Methanococcus voltae]MBP2143064.1 putative membrane protein [Methanococcus voltae]